MHGQIHIKFTELKYNLLTKYRKVFEDSQVQNSIRNVYQKFKFPEVLRRVL